MKEISHVGFLDTDLLSTMFLFETSGTLYVFNYGNFPKIRRFMMELERSTKAERTKIEDWLSNRLRDEGLDVDIEVLKIERVNTIDVPENEIMSNPEYRYLLAPDLLKISFTSSDIFVILAYQNL